MTIEEAKEKAKNMSKIQMLQKLKEDMENHGWDQVDIIYTNGTRTGIGNPKAVTVVKEALMKELQRQMDEECWL